MEPVEVEAGRCGLDEDAEGLVSQPPGPGKDEKADERSEQRVGVGPTGDDHDQGGGDDSDRPGEIGEHLEVGALDVERLPGTSAKEAPSDDVDDEPGDCHHQHRHGRHLGRLPEALHSLVEDIPGDDE